MAGVIGRLRERCRHRRSALALVHRRKRWYTVIRLPHVSRGSRLDASVPMRHRQPLTIVGLSSSAARVLRLHSATRDPPTAAIRLYQITLAQDRLASNPASLMKAASCVNCVVSESRAMRHRFLAPVWLGIAFVLHTSAARAFDPQDVAKMLDPSVVRIILSGPEGTASGTGFVINRDGYVATNFHVVRWHAEFGWKIFVVPSGAPLGDQHVAELVAGFPNEDLAILRVKGLDRAPVQLIERDGGEPAKGAPVFAIGFPGAADRLGPIGMASFAAGTASRLFSGSWSEGAPAIRIIQHTAATNPGISGGPLANACGQVVGVNSQREAQLIIAPGGIPIVTDPIQGLFFASHASVLLEKLRELRIPFSGARKRCRTILGIASTSLDVYVAVGILLGIAAVSAIVLFKPRPVVQVVVRCCEFVADCCRDAVDVIRRAQRAGTSIAGSAIPFERHAPGTLVSGSTWTLSSRKGDGAPVEITVWDTELSLAEEGLVIGSEPSEADRVLIEPDISPRHARIVALAGSLGIVDLHSAAGTAVDGKRLDPNGEPVPLYPGSQITIGSLALTLRRR